MKKNTEKSFKKIFQVFLMLIFLMLSFSFVKNVLAEKATPTGIESAQSGLDTAANKGFDGDAADSGVKSVMTDIPTAIGKIVGAGLAFVGVLFFILMIYGGITWMLARGNETDVTKAKELLQSAVIGLVIVLAAYIITNFISSSLVK